MLSSYPPPSRHPFCSVNGNVVGLGYINGSCSTDETLSTAKNEEARFPNTGLSDDRNWLQLCKGSYLGVKSSIADDLTTKDDLYKGVSFQTQSYCVQPFLFFASVGWLVCCHLI